LLLWHCPRQCCLQRMHSLHLAQQLLEAIAMQATQLLL
jgi:hypothetical protein